jgi:hypothetical protein
VWDNGRNGIEPISFHRFHGGRDSTIHICIWRYHHSSMSKWKLHQIRIIIASKCYWLLINHLSNRWYVIRRSRYDALSLVPSFHWSFSPQCRGHVPGEINRPMTAIREIFLAPLSSLFPMGAKK